MARPPIPAETVPVVRLQTLIRRWGRLRGKARRECEAAPNEYQRGFEWGNSYGLGEAAADVRAIIDEAKGKSR